MMINKITPSIDKFTGLNDWIILVWKLELTNQVPKVLSQQFTFQWPLLPWKNLKSCFQALKLQIQILINNNTLAVPS